MARGFASVEFGRSVLAVVVGFVFIAALWFGTDAVLRVSLPEALAGGQAGGMVLVATLVYSGLFAIAGCYLAARLAPSRPMAHALVLGGLALVLNGAAMLTLWGALPAWYTAVSLLLVVPYAWLGGRLRQAEIRGECLFRSAEPAGVLTS
jgi:hypothetical protein